MRDHFQDQLNSFLHGDNLAILKVWPDASADLFVMSPSYNLRNTTA